MSKRELAVSFLERFCAGDVDGLLPLLSESLRFDGPFFQFNSRDDYLSCLRQNPPGTCRLRVLGITESLSQVSVFYDYVKPDGSITVAQLFEFEGNTISKILVVFDGRGAG